MRVLRQVAMAEFITNHIALVKPYFGLSSRRRPVLSESYLAMKRRGYAMRPPPPSPTNAAATTARFALANAEDTQLPDTSFDLVTVMYAFHEAPRLGREKMLREARRLLSPGGILAVVDICTEYAPSLEMLKGEPYVQEYQANIHGQLASIPGFEQPHYQEIVPHHLGMWTLRRTAGVA
jgi:SAM-dependent methyltransferase